MDKTLADAALRLFGTFDGHQIQAPETVALHTRLHAFKNAHYIEAGPPFSLNRMGKLLEMVAETISREYSTLISTNYFKCLARFLSFLLLVHKATGKRLASRILKGHPSENPLIDHHLPRIRPDVVLDNGPSLSELIHQVIS